MILFDLLVSELSFASKIRKFCSEKTFSQVRSYSTTFSNDYSSLFGIWFIVVLLTSALLAFVLPILRKFPAGVSRSFVWYVGLGVAKGVVADFTTNYKGL